MTRRFGAVDSWWVTDEGRRYKDVVRSVSAIRLNARVEPKGKRAQQNDELRELMLSAARTWHGMDGRYGANWPRPKAAVALDIWCLTRSRNPPRIDKICKWLLDELGAAKGRPIVFNDDRQVKMLFARIDVLATGGVMDSDALLGPTSTPSIHVIGQTVAKVREGVRRAVEMEEPWPVRAVSSEIDHILDEGSILWSSLQGAIDRAELYQDETSEWERRQLRRELFNCAFVTQKQMLARTDEMAALVVSQYAYEGRTGTLAHPATAKALEWLLSSPYAVELGVLPERPGDGNTFLEQARSALRRLGTCDQRWFPLLSAVGLSLFYVESSTGKDLDNIFLKLLPLVLETLKPPAETMHPWASQEMDEWDRFRKGEIPVAGSPAVSFIEAVALTKIDNGRFPPGTVILTLSMGGRLESWWASAMSYVNRPGNSPW